MEEVAEINGWCSKISFFINDKFDSRDVAYVMLRAVLANLHWQTLESS
jgi:hypothetical protein